MNLCKCDSFAILIESSKGLGKIHNLINTIKVIVPYLSSNIYKTLDEIELLNIRNIWFENGSYNKKSKRH